MATLPTWITAAIDSALHLGHTTEARLRAAVIAGRRGVRGEQVLLEIDKKKVGCALRLIDRQLPDLMVEVGRPRRSPLSMLIPVANSTSAADVPRLNHDLEPVEDLIQSSSVATW